MQKDFLDKIVGLCDKLPLPMKSDKKAHLVCGFLIAFVVTITFSKPSIGFLVGSICAIVKEIDDHITYNGFDYKDLLITILGAWIGSALGFALLVAYALRY
jgi:hypothetical protein